MEASHTTEFGPGGNGGSSTPTTAQQDIAKSIAKIEEKGSAANWGIGATEAYAAENYSEQYVRTAGVWIGYGKDQAKTLREDYSNIYNYYSTNPNIYFVENPRWEQFSKALTKGYNTVFYHTHGSPRGLKFNDGYHSLSELNDIAGNINTATLGICSCFPGAQRKDWDSLQVSNTLYIDLSVTVGETPYADRDLGIDNVYREVLKH